MKLEELFYLYFYYIYYIKSVKKVDFYSFKFILEKKEKNPIQHLLQSIREKAEKPNQIGRLV